MDRYYLAYGSNLNMEQMKLRCKEAIKVGKATIKDYRLLFKGSPYRSHLTIESEVGYIVPVGVFKISPNDEYYLDMYEGYPSYYYKKDMKVDVLFDDGTYKSLDCFCYIMRDNNDIGIPTDDYIDVVLQGYDDFGFDKTLIYDALLYSKNMMHK